MAWSAADYLKPFDDMAADANDISDTNGATATATMPSTPNPNDYSGHINGNAALIGDSLSNAYIDEYYANGLSTALPSSSPLSPVLPAATATSISSASASLASASASASSSFYPFNQSFQYDYVNDMPTNGTGSTRLGYDSGSNYMLLVEDFSTYFHNYNDSMGIGIGTTGPTNLNATGLDFQPNCSLTNSTCDDGLGELASATTFCYCR